MLARLMLVALTMAAAPRAAVAFDFVNGVIVDPGRDTAFVMAPSGRIDKVDLTSGAVTASSTRGAKPLLLYGDTILAEAETAASGQLDLAGLAAGDLSPRFAAAIPLPQDVPALIDDRLGASFLVGARRVGSEIIVAWRFVRRPVSGVPTRAPAQIEEGFARLDDKGRVLGAGVGRPAAPPPAAAGMPAALRTLVDKGVVAGRPCRIGGIFAAAEFHEEKSGTTGVLLRRWDAASGKALPRRRLFGPELTFQQVSADCRDLLASRAEKGWQWSIYSMADGRRIARSPMPVPGALFFVWKKSVIYQAAATGRLVGGRLRLDQPPKLTAVDLETSAERWARPIRDTRYFGPYPGTPPGRRMQ